MSNNTGGAAFPHHIEHPNGHWPVITHAGMSMRDYFAAKAMQAAATNPTGADGFTFEQRAEWAYLQADAMLKAREQK